MPNKLIFIFSLPRAGSTLLQRMLARHTKISSTPEPWFLLPFVYSLRQHGVYAQYSHVSLSVAMADVVNSLPGKRDDYYESLRLFSLSLYEKLNRNNAEYFLDKTPRYYLIIKDIAKIFPEAKFIFLFRNPLSVLSSSITSFYNDRLGDWRHKIDLYKGPQLLVDGYELLQDKSLRIQYEQLILEPERVLREVCEYLSIEFSEEMISDFTQVSFDGAMGDSIGSKKYSQVEPETLGKWRPVLSTYIRKLYAKRYLNFLGNELVSKLGYDHNKLLNDVDSLDSSSDKFCVDLAELTLCQLRVFLDLPMFIRKIKYRISTGERLFVHY